MISFSMKLRMPYSLISPEIFPSLEASSNGTLRTHRVGLLYTSVIGDVLSLSLESVDHQVYFFHFVGRVLLDHAACSIFELLQSFRMPPLFQVPVLIELSTLQI